MTLNRLTLVRHAKSSWQEPGQSDHDRPLNPRGERDAPMMAHRVAEQLKAPDLILCSSAKRTQQTADVFQQVLQLTSEQIMNVPALYLASPQTILDCVTNVASTDHIMVIAHNPGLETLSYFLDAKCSDPMPTLGIRSFAISPTALVKNSPTESSAFYGDPEDNKMVASLTYLDYPKNI